MPQMEIGDYAPQIVWLTITFVVMYVLMWRLALPRLARILEGRQERINGDLGKAETLKEEAEAALKAYEETMAKARAEAEAILREASERLSEEAAARNAELSRKLADQTKEAEARIDEARSKAVDKLGQVAAEAAGAAVARLIGVELERAKVEAAVEAVAPRRE